ncbi:MAG: hypothetical protein AAGE52_20570 [Myxococcota bacterium]
MDFKTRTYLEDFIGEAELDELDEARSLITEENVDIVAQMYPQSLDYPEPSPLVAVSLVCAYDTPTVRRVGLHFLLTVADDKTEPMRRTRSMVLGLLEPGDLRDPAASYYESDELREAAEARVRAANPEPPDVEDLRTDY